MKFTIRDLFLVTVIVALAVGAWLDRQYLATENARLEVELAEKDRTLNEIFQQIAKVNTRLVNALDPVLPTSPAPAPISSARDP